MVYVHPDKGPTATLQTEREKERIRKKILQHWQALGPAEKKGRQAMVRHLSEELDIPAIVIEQHLAEWESSKSG